MNEMYADQDVDAETIFGQVELQNAPLLKFMKKEIRKFTKLDQKKDALLQLVDLSQIHDDGESNDEKEEGSSSSDIINDEDDVSTSSSEDSESRRIRLRMERSMAMAEADEQLLEDGESSENEIKPKKSKSSTRKLSRAEQEELDNDPMAKDMNDGFFDVHEMEGFADEEEDLHMRKFGRTTTGEHDDDSDSVSSDNDDDDMLFHEKGGEDDDNFDPSGKKQFREEAEIRALMDIYNDPTGDSDDMEDDDGGVDPANMAASDFFGRPDQKYFHKYQARQQKRKYNDEASYDSWDEHDFGKKDKDDDEDLGWRKKHQNELTTYKKEEEENDDSEEKGSGSSDSGEDSDDDSGKEAKSAGTTEKPSSGRDAKTDAKIRALEEEAMAEKPWNMRGEITGGTRPENSLLEGTPEFELAAKTAPVINVQHTENLEDAIRRRILEEDWDDVIPRELSDINGANQKGELPEVSQEKSKLSLGELYEREYLKKAAGYDVEAVEKQTEEDKAKNEMKGLFANLCSKLDALSNYHFAPRPVEPEADIRLASAPAIALEEALPLHVSDGRAAAPEEVYRAKRGRESVLKGDSEMDQVERKRLRNAKKRARRKARQETLADEKVISKLTPGLGLNNPYEKRKLREELSAARGLGKVTDGVVDANNKDYTQSTAFFKNLQESVKNEASGKADGKSKADASEKKKSSAFKL